MRRFYVFGAILVAIGCSGRDATPRSAAAAQDLAVALFADEGIRCVRQEPPPFRACAGLDPGAACAWMNRSGRGRDFGMCRQLNPGRLLCIGVDEPEEPGDCDPDDNPDGGGACDAGVPFPGDGGLPPPVDGGLPGGDGGVPLPVDGGVPADDGGPAMDGGSSGDGGVPGAAGFSISPIAPALDACAAHEIDSACSFTFYGQQVDGLCRALRGGATLLCAPICGGH